MKKFFTTFALIVTTITGLFAEEKKWNIDYHVRTVTYDEFYATVILNPCWQEYDWWIDEDHDNTVDYADPYWDNDVVKTAIAQEVDSIEGKLTSDRVYAFIEISYGDSFDDKLNTIRVFIKDLRTYETWEFCLPVAALIEMEKE